MELSELAQIRLIVLGVGLIIAAFWAGGIVAGRRRQFHFASLAQSLGCKAVREGQFLSRFAVAVDGRSFEVRYQHIGKGAGVGGWAPGWYVVTETTLKGVTDMHSAEIRPRARRPRAVDPDDHDFGKYFALRDAGYPLREGWLNHRTRGAIAHFYALALPLDPLVIEEARLIHRAHLPVRRLDAGSLREVLTRQAQVAAALENAL